MRCLETKMTDNDGNESYTCYICGWVTDSWASIVERAGVHICTACDDEFDQILIEQETVFKEN
jgi:hypothetical protein